MWGVACIPSDGIISLWLVGVQHLADLIAKNIVDVDVYISGLNQGIVDHHGAVYRVRIDGPVVQHLRFGDAGSGRDDIDINNGTGGTHDGIGTAIGAGASCRIGNG